jgi:5-(carboxyamino)imidazole ribonucleotide synthase
MPSLSEETHGAVKMLQPGATIGIIGGGQLGRMMALSAKYMGFRIGGLPDRAGGRFSGRR